MNKAPLLLTIMGVAFLLLSLLALAVSVLIPIVNAPHASWEEALIGIIPSVGCSCFSLLILLSGVIWLIVARQQR